MRRRSGSGRGQQSGKQKEIIRGLEMEEEEAKEKEKRENKREEVPHCVHHADAPLPHLLSTCSVLTSSVRTVGVINEG